MPVGGWVAGGAAPCDGAPGSGTEDGWACRAESAEARSGTVIRDGSVMDKAQLLLDHLRKLALVQPPA